MPRDFNARLRRIDASLKRTHAILQHVATTCHPKDRRLTLALQRLKRCLDNLSSA